ncbi:nuclear transport factor 2 family protein [Halomonas denitrificans]|nr:nuclear transport factor 2 family protein [Halomonas denitrificans]
MRFFIVVLIAVLMALPAATRSAVADDQAELEHRLRTFLAGANERPAHESFWADDLIYTSSAGERFGKADILAGFDEKQPADAFDPAPPAYGAEDVTVRVMEDIAVVTFRLTAHLDGERIGEYFNTGVFRNDDGEWKAFTWQATRIPDGD